MKTGTITGNENGIGRRTFLAGAAAGAALLAAGPAMAAFPGAAMDAGSPVTGKFKPVDLFAHHCSLVHASISKKLARDIADPEIDDVNTAVAIRSASCPCCGTRIGAGFQAVEV